MRYFKFLSISWLPLALSLSLPACSSTNTPNTTSGGGGGGGGCTHFDYATYMAGTAPLTLTANVMPIFTASCALGVPCHGNGSHPPNLGGTGVAAADISAAIVDVTSTEVASMKYVAKGDPQNSLMMRKIEQDDPGCELTCANPTGFPAGCKSRMPSGGPPWLPDADQKTIRDWIKQGANM